MLGWTKEIPELLASHHLVISKAGGATVQEAIAAGCPMIMNQVAPGQEEGNADLLLRNEAGALAENPGAVVAAVERAFADDGAVWRRWSEGMARMSRPRAAFDTANFILAEIARREGAEPAQGPAMISAAALRYRQRHSAIRLRTGRGEDSGPQRSARRRGVGRLRRIEKRLRGRADEPGGIPRRRAPQVHFTGTDAEFTSIWEDIFAPNPPMDAVIERLHHDGLPLYLLSNTNDIHVDWFRARYPIFGKFAGAVFSHEERLMKPDPEIFQRAIARFSLTPAETVYVDDYASEHRGRAKALGFLALPYDYREHHDFERRLWAEL